MEKFKPNYTVHPGETILEEIIYDWYPGDDERDIVLREKLIKYIHGGDEMLDADEINRLRGIFHDDVRPSLRLWMKLQELYVAERSGGNVCH